MAALTPANFVKLSEPIEQVYSNIVDSLLINMAKHFAANKTMATQEWEIKKLGELNQLSKESVKIIASLSSQAPDLVTKALEQAVLQGTLDVEEELKEAVKNGALKAAAGENALASSSVREVLEAYQAQTKETLNLVNTTMLDSTLAQYRSIITNTAKIEQQIAVTQEALNTAAGQVVTGVQSRTQALRQALMQVHKEGITGYFDRAGRRWTPEAYINMDIRTTAHNVAIESVKIRQQDYGVKIFRVSRHSGARPLCYPYQGKYYSWDNSSGTFTDGEGKRHKYYPISSTSYGKPAGLFGINCGHHPITVIPGVTIPRDRQKQNKAENDKQYELSQEQRRLEREVRYAKQKAAMLEAAGDKEGFTEESLKIKQKQAAYNAFCKQTGRTKRLDRTQVYEYNRSVSSKATAAVKRTEKAKATKQEAEKKKKAEIRERIRSDETPKQLNPGNQNKHIMGSKGYQEGRSYLYGDLSTAQEIVNTYHGTGEIILTRSGEWSNKEVITAAEDLGVEVNPTTGSETATNRATIHYGKNGTHVVPARREKKT